MQQFAAQEIGARIERARKERGLTQEELAAMASFSKRSLQDYEYGVTIPYKHLRELSRLLKRPEEWFLYGDDEKDEEDALTEETGRELASLLREALPLLRQQAGEEQAEESAAPTSGTDGP